MSAPVPAGSQDGGSGENAFHFVLAAHLAGEKPENEVVAEFVFASDAV